MGEIRYWCFANKQIFSGLEIYHFPTAGGNARLRVSLRETKKRPLKKIKISPKSWGVLKSFLED